MPELKPCPFCGGKARLDRYEHFYRVLCTDCPASTEWLYSEQEAIEAWNRRVNECDREEMLALAEEIDANGDALLADTSLLVGSVGLMRCYAERIRKALGVKKCQN